MTTIRKTAAIAALLLVAGVAQAAPPKTITYSGFLLDSTGAPVGASSTLTFRLYDAATAGNLVYSEAVTVVPSTSDGYFSATIGLVQLLPDVVFSMPLYLAVKFGAEAEMAPRIPLTSVPSAFTAVTVDWTGIQNRPSSACSGSTPYVTGIDQNGVVVCAAAPAGSGGCASGQVQKWNGAAWTCQADANTTYTVAAPLALTGSEISIALASATTSGALSSADWITFNGKLSTVNSSAPLSGNGTSGSPLTIAQANGTTSGFLSSADWVAFNAKLGAVTSSAPLSGSGTSGSPLVIAAANGTTGGYLTAADWILFSNKVSSVGVATNGGLAVAGGSSPVLSLVTSCGDGGVLRWNAGTSAWECSTALAGGSIAGTFPISVSAGTTPTVSIQQASSATDGYLVSGDWNTFNNKLGFVTALAPLSGDGTAASPLALGAASALAPGYLTSTAYAYFAGKPDLVNVSAPLSGDGVMAPLSIGPGSITLDLLAPSGCAPDAIPRWDGVSWGCSTDRGLVTSVSATPGGGILVGGSPTAPELSLDVSGVVPGSYTMVLVDGAGRVYSGANPTTLGEYGITDAVALQRPAMFYQTGDVAAENAFFMTNLDVGGGATVGGSLSVSGPIFGNLASSSIRPSHFIATAGPADGQVASKAAGLDSFAWVTPVTGLSGGSGISVTGSAPAPTVSVSYGGTGTAGTVARSDHNHDAAYAAFPTMGSGGTSTTITPSSENFAFPAGSTVTFAKRTACMVTTQVNLNSNAVYTGYQNFYPAVKRGAAANTMYGTNVLVGGWAAAGYQGAAMTFPIWVNANEATSFGCDVYWPPANFTSFECRIQWICF